MDPDPGGPKTYPQHCLQDDQYNVFLNTVFYGQNWPAGHNEDILGILHRSDGPGSQKHLQENPI